MTRNFKVAAVAALAGALALSGCSGEKKETVDVVGFSILKSANEDVFKAFEDTDDGKGVTFKTSYGASGDQSRAVEGGQAADFVHFSLETDVTRLVDEGKVAEDWNQDKTKGIITSSVVVFVVRPGNPDNIKTWEDLTKPGVEVITPNPFTSGGARWNVMAAYGAQLKAGKSSKQGYDYMVKLFKNVSVQDKSARESLNTFASGKGDVLIGYENEAIFAKKNGVQLQYIVPSSTILIENPLAAAKNAPSQAKAFVKWLKTPPAQKIWAENGYRPVVPSVLKQAKFPKPAKLFKIGYVGGWNVVSKKWFDRQNGLMLKVEQQAQGG